MTQRKRRALADLAAAVLESFTDARLIALQRAAERLKTENERLGKFDDPGMEVFREALNTQVGVRTSGPSRGEAHRSFFLTPS